MTGDLIKLQQSIHGIDFDFVIAEWDRQVSANRDYYDTAMLGHAANIENLLTQLRDEYRAFMDAGDKNQNPKKLAVDRLAEECEKIVFGGAL